MVLAKEKNNNKQDNAFMINQNSDNNMSKATNNSQQDIITSQHMTDINQVVDKSAISMPLVAVYCGSRMGSKPIYEQTARELGKALADNGLGLVYGGASIGLMGAVADEVVKADADTVGVIPTFMLQREVAHNKLTKLHLTDTMHTRKAIMAEYADAFITLPGGLGTLEEIMEIATWGQLFQHKKPMILLNIAGYYDRLIDHLRYSVDEGFIGEHDLEKLLVCDDVEAAITALQGSVLIKDEFSTDKV